MQTKTFRRQLTNEIDDLCSSRGLDAQQTTELGHAFELWCARQFIDADPRYSVEADDVVVGGPRDLGIDIVLRDDASGEVLICQCKYISSRSRTSDDAIESFFTLHDRLADQDWVTEHASRALLDALPDADQLKDNPASITYRFVTTGKISDRSRQRWQSENVKRGALRRELWGIEELKAHYIEAASLSQSIPAWVGVDLPRDQYMEVDGPYPGIVAILKTNALRDLWLRWREAIYAYNIRGYLGGNPLNNTMRQTVQDRPSDFFYFNNGVSAVCTEYTIIGSRLEAKNLQIINGAQTLNAIRHVGPQSEGRVLFRLTKTTSVKTESGINAEIIRYNNSQNIVKDADFRSNDSIQQWLEKRIKEWDRRWRAVEQFYYLRKRVVGGRRGKGRGRKLEEFAKIRYAWLHEPYTISAMPRSLFHDSDTGGRYLEAFGINGDAVNVWPDDVVDEAMLAVAFYDRIGKTIDGLARRDPDQFAWVKGHRWHFLALAGLFVRHRGAMPATLLRNADQCDAEFDSYIRRAIPIVRQAEQRRAEADKASWRNWRASPEEWRRVKETFEGDLRAEAALEAELASGN